MKRFEGKISLDYHLVPGAVPYYYELQDALASVISRLFRKAIVVDIGIGTGITTKAIIEKNPSCVVRGVDSEHSMIKQAQSNLEAEVERGSVEVYCSDALDYLRGLADASIEAVASSYTLHNCLKNYRERLEREIFRVLRPRGVFVNNDKYAADDKQEYLKELTDQIIRYDVLKEQGRDDLRRIWIEHELEDQDPERVMWTCQALGHLESIGFSEVSLVERIGQYAIVTARKP